MNGVNDGEVQRQQLFLEIANSVHGRQSVLRQMLAYVDKLKFSFTLWSDVILAFVMIGNGWNDTLEGVWTIFQFMVASVFVFSVAVYSSSGRCLPLQFLLISFGIYDIQWKLRKEKNDREHRPVVSQYIHANTGDRYRRFTKNELWAAVALVTNDLVDTRLEFVYNISAEILMASAKLIFLFHASSPTDVCSFKNSLTVFMIIIAIFGPIKAIVSEELATMKFLKIFNLIDAFDAGDFSNYKTAFQTKTTKLMTMIFHAVGVCYRVLLISFFVQVSIGAGFVFVAALLLISFIIYKTLRPKYENAPVGAPTNCYAILEVICGIFTVRNHRISGSSFCEQLGRILLFVIMKSFEHFGLLLIIIEVYSIYDPMYVIENDSFIQCDNVFFNSISSALSVFTVSFNHEDTYFDVVLKHKLLLGMFCLYQLYSIIFFLYLHFAGMNDNRFPAHTSMHIYSDKFLKESWSRRSHDWVLKMMFCTVTDKSVSKLRKVSLLPTLEQMGVYSHELQNVPAQLPISAFALRDQLLIDHPLSEQLFDLAFYLYEKHPDCRVTIGLCYEFCRVFEERMTQMTSYRLAVICDLLGESPIIKSKFTDDPIANAWFWLFK